MSDPGRQSGQYQLGSGPRRRPGRVRRRWAARHPGMAPHWLLRWSALLLWLLRQLLLLLRWLHGAGGRRRLPCASWRLPGRTRGSGLCGQLRLPIGRMLAWGNWWHACRSTSSVVARDTHS